MKKLDTVSVLVLACCLCVLAPACAMHAVKAAPPAATTNPAPAQPARQPVEIAADLPISVPQTQVTLPSPQPVQDEALIVVKPESPPAQPPAAPVKPPRSAAPKPEPRQQTVAPPPTTAPPVSPPASRRRIRPVESAAERRRLTAEIATHQKRVQDILIKARSRQLSEAEKTAVERIQAFLEQTESALKDQDLQQAAALSNRALLLSQDLNGEK